jgi:hypothetical protein
MAKKTFSFEEARRLKAGEKVKAGDILVFNQGYSYLPIKACKYQSELRCCVGHVVEAHEVYIRKEKAS